MKKPANKTKEADKSEMKKSEETIEQKYKTS